MATSTTKIFLCGASLLGALITIPAACGDPDCTQTATCDPPLTPTGGSGGSATVGSGGSAGTGAGGGQPNPKDDGEACDGGTECRSGFCVDSVCCDTACDGLCVACDLSSSPGTCSPHPDGEDPGTECGLATCDGAGSCAYGRHLWSKLFDGAGVQSAVEAVLDDGDFAVFTGDFDADTTDGNVHLHRYTPNGTKSFSTQFGDSPFDQDPGAVATDANGNIFLGGSYDSLMGFTINSLPEATTGTSDLFLVKFDSGQTDQWVKAFDGGSGFVRMNGLAADSAGAVVAVGFFSQSISLDGGAAKTSQLNDSFVAKFDANGAHVFSYTSASANHDAATSVAVDSQDNVVVFGEYDEAMQLGGTALPAGTSEQQLYVIKLSPTGSVLWAKGFVSAGLDTAHDVAVDANDDIILVGELNLQIDFGGGVLTAADSRDVFVAKLDASGNHVWSKAFGGAGNDFVDGVGVDALGDIVVGGNFQDSIDFGGETLNTTGDFRVYVAKLTAAGDHVWSRDFASSAGSLGMDSLHVGSSGNILMSGTLNGDVTFGGDTFTGTSNDVFLVKLGP